MNNLSRSTEFYSADHVTAALAGRDDVQTFNLPNARLAFIAGFVGLDRSRKLLRSLTDELEWQQPVLKMFGREVQSPRLHAWHGDAHAAYRWSGRTWQPQPWVPILDAMRDSLEQQLGIRFNSCLVNRYRSGDDAMGWHADDEPELGRNPVIASVSLGALRDFDLRYYKTDQNSVKVDPFRIPLGDGSLLVMFGETQHYWKHRVRRQRQVTGERLNLTFRYISRMPSR